MSSQFDKLSDTECIAYAAQCLAEGISVPESVKHRLKELGVYTLIMEAARGAFEDSTSN